MRPDFETMQADAEGDLNSDLLTQTGGGSLLSTGYFHNRAVIERIRPNEQPHYILCNRKKGLLIEHEGTTEHIRPSSDYRSVAVISDHRLLFVVGKTSGDWEQSIELSSIQAVKVSSGWTKDKLTVTTGDRRYEFYSRKSDETEAAAGFIRDGITDQPEDPGGTPPEETEFQWIGSSSNAPEQSTSSERLTQGVSEDFRDEQLVQRIRQGQKELDATSNLEESSLEVLEEHLSRAHSQFCHALAQVRAAGREEIELPDETITESRLSELVKELHLQLDDIQRARRLARNASAHFNTGQEQFEAGDSELAMSHLVHALQLYRDAQDTLPEQLDGAELLGPDIERAAALLAQTTGESDSYPSNVEELVRKNTEETHPIRVPEERERQ